MIKEEQKTKLGDLEKKIKIGYQDVSVERDTTTFQKQSDAYGEYDHRKNTVLK